MKRRTFIAAIPAAMLLFNLTACGNLQSDDTLSTEASSIQQVRQTEIPVTPAEESTPADEKTSAGESTPADEKTSAGESTPADEKTSAEESTPADEKASAEESTPADENAAGADETWKVDFEKSLLESYGVVPDHYEDLGNGVYQVYVEIDGKIVPYVAVDSATGDYHG